MIPPQTRYAQTSDGDVAYQVVGGGTPDLVYVGGFTHLDVFWDFPPLARALEHLASFSRLILFDRRGLGLSDPIPLNPVPTWEAWTEDLRVVLDAVGSERAAIFTERDAGMMGMLFAATLPHRASALILANASARLRKAADYPFGLAPEVVESLIHLCEEQWGTDSFAAFASPSLTADASFCRWFSRLQRSTATPRRAAGWLRYHFDVDVRAVLGSIRAPTLLLHSSDNPVASVEHGRYLAEHISGAKFVGVPGGELYLLFERKEEVLGPIEEFLTGARAKTDSDRILATLLFTDIVASTERAAELGDGKWHDLLNRHHTAIREQLGRFCGNEVDTAGDGFLATFDGPARAIRCALAIRDAVRSLGLEVRTSVHTGECELMETNVAGLAVHIGARILANARAGEVLVSGTVKDLVVGSGLSFQDRGVHHLKGVPGEWRLFSVG
jgi:class 3 adenylate cyclase